MRNLRRAATRGPSTLIGPKVLDQSGGLPEAASAFFEPLRRRVADLCPLPSGIRIGDLGAQSGLAGALVAARSLLQAHVALEATSDGSDCSTHGRASGRLSMEVER
jgi:hypothetical protein